MSTSPQPVSTPAQDEAPREKPMTIGAVCKALVQEFPDISISKIRYLEDQKLLTPQRTPGGYRLYTKSDVARLRAILRLQRDEFLPLRVIRQELASGGAETGATATTSAAEAARTRRRPAVTAPSSTAQFRIEDIVEETRADPKLIQELQDYGVIAGQQRGGTVWYDDTEREIVRAVVELARYGVTAHCVLPGWIQSEMTQGLIDNEKFVANVMPRIPMRRFGKPEDFAAVAVYIMSQGSSYHTAEMFLIDGAYSIF